MVLNTGIVVVKRALTIENIAQVVLAGVRNPQLGFAVAVGKLASAAQEVVTPEYVSARAQEVMNEEAYVTERVDAHNTYCLGFFVISPE